MQDYYNATDAARIIGISYKTILRRLDEGKIEAVKGDDGQYSIATTEVERLRILQFTRPRPVKSTVVLSGQDQSNLEQRVTDLEQRVRTLEAMVSQDHTSPVVTGQEKTAADIPPKPRPQKQPQARKSDLPEGCILASKFAEQLGIPRRTFSDYMLLGLGKGLIGMSADTIPQKEMIEYSERPKPGREHTGERERYLTPAQQERALELLRKHGKLP